MNKTTGSFAIFLLLLMAAVPALGTYQTGDILVLDGEELRIPIFPLEEYEPVQSGVFRFRTKPGILSSGNYRGYVAKWEIEAGKLWLVDIDGWIQRCTEEDYKSLDPSARTSEEPCYEKASVDAVFGEAASDGRVFASWYSGDLLFPGLRWGSSSNAQEQELHGPKALLVVSIQDGFVASISDYRESE